MTKHHNSGNDPFTGPRKTSMHSSVNLKQESTSVQNIHFHKNTSQTFMINGMNNVHESMNGMALNDMADGTRMN